MAKMKHKTSKPDKERGCTFTPYPIFNFLLQKGCEDVKYCFEDRPMVVVEEILPPCWNTSLNDKWSYRYTFERHIFLRLPHNLFVLPKNYFITFQLEIHLRKTPVSLRNALRTARDRLLLKLMEFMNFKEIYRRDLNIHS